jgi:hypothetical protein
LKTRSHASLGTKAALLALAFLLGTGVAGAQGFSSAHWKAKSQIEGGPQGDMSTESESWMKEKKVRVRTKVMGMDMNVIKSGDFAYQWQEGQNSGMKMPAKMRRRGGASMDFLEKMEDVRTKGKKVGTETIDGHPCEIYEYTEPAAEAGGSGPREPAKEKYWLARDLKNFPVKTIAETGNMKITTTNYDIDLGAHVSEAMVTPPENVKFTDMSDMMKGMAPKGH